MKLSSEFHGQTYEHIVTDEGVDQLVQAAHRDLLSAKTTESRTWAKVFLDLSLTIRALHNYVKEGTSGKEVSQGGSTKRAPKNPKRVQKEAKKPQNSPAKGRSKPVSKGVDISKRANAPKNKRTNG